MVLILRNMLVGIITGQNFINKIIRNKYVDSKEQRIEKLAGIKSMYDIDLKGRITPEEQKLYDDCINLRISVQEFYEQLRIVIAKKHLTEPYYEDESMVETEMHLSEKEAKRMFGNKRLVFKEIIV